MKNQKKVNFLDLIPVHSKENQWIVTDGKVTILMEHRGFYSRIAQRFFHRPRISRIDLEPFGSFIWQQIDSRRTVGEIALLLEEQFGSEVEPLYDRLTVYMRILKNNRFIELKIPE